MDSKTVEKISGQVSRQFPEVAGVKPSIQAQGEENFLLIFKGSATLADGKKIARTVRVVATGSGKVVKVTTSR